MPMRMLQLEWLGRCEHLTGGNELELGPNCFDKVPGAGLELAELSRPRFIRKQCPKARNPLLNPSFRANVRWACGGELWAGLH